MSACYARLDDGITAHDYATKCMYERPEWPKAYYRLGRYTDAADAFLESLRNLQKTVSNSFLDRVHKINCYLMANS
ncbi:hypothetical protein MKX01_037063 [Papaver californicum]|nr:hypothetical protein MKX01_037063 [Papaver californicum]